MLVLTAPSVELSDRFHRGRIGERDLVEHPVLVRWARASQLGVRADAAAHPEGESSTDLAVRRDRVSDALREPSRLLVPWIEELSSRSVVAIVADHEGVILEARGASEFVGRAAQVRLVEGARWSEGARGTNAIGTALVERRPVAVVGRAHFEERNHGLFCYATPIRDPYGEVVAALDVTGALEQHDPSLGPVVAAAGAAIERALCVHAYGTAGGLPLLERIVERCRTPLLLVEASGRVRLANAAARDGLGISSTGDDVLACERVFGAAASDLASLALGSSGTRFETARGSYDVDLDPVFGPGGRVLAVLVHLEPVALGRLVGRTARPASAPPRAAVAVSAAAPIVHHAAFSAILGDDADLLRAKDTAARFASTALPVLLLAETGTGKELFARAIHAASSRASGPFVALNCGALTPSLLESELFGYGSGAFTGARRGGLPGKLAAADGGTLFLDEIAEMPEALQAALLRVLDDGVYYPVGDPKPRRADFRLVCATCRDLPGLVERGAFRRDLFFRIHGASLTIPPLSARADRTLLALGLLARLASDLGRPCPELDASALAHVEGHSWPGNVRELKSALAHALALAGSGTALSREHFPRALVGAAPGSGAVVRTRDEVVGDAVAEAVRASGGNLSEAARRLGVARSTLYRALGTKRRA